jgi:hypothetical protein
MIARVPTNCQVEPPYPGLETVVFVLRSPNMTAHNVTALCSVEQPHPIADCGEWNMPVNIAGMPRAEAEKYFCDNVNTILEQAKNGSDLAKSALTAAIIYSESADRDSVINHHL